MSAQTETQKVATHLQERLQGPVIEARPFGAGLGMQYEHFPTRDAAQAFADEKQRAGFTTCLVPCGYAVTVQFWERTP